jgi:hypothetical protein
MSNAYEELGGAGGKRGKRTPAPATPKPARHKWRVVHREFRAAKYRCKVCGTFRTIISDTAAAFPRSRYTTRDGVISHGKAPACTPARP